MTEYDCLHRGVCRDPSNDTPRLMLADWLSEHDEMERGEFIRLQCAIVALPESIDCLCNRCGRKESRTTWSVQSRCMKCRGSMRREDGSRVPHNTKDRRCPQIALRSRERELLDANWLEWASELPSGITWWLTPGMLTRETGNALVAFTRGFISHITLDWQSWLKHSPGLYFPPPQKCERCNGGDDDNYPEWAHNCPTCHGSGEVPATEECGRCKGNGRHRTAWKAECPDCTSGLIPRVWRGTEQPLEEVTLVDNPRHQSSDGRVFHGSHVPFGELWPGLRFKLPSGDMTEARDYNYASAFIAAGGIVPPAR